MLSSMPQPVFRFAPSPNGYLHLGHALSALLNFDMARAAGGRFLLRIEDIDTARCRPEFEAAIYEDLAWLGLTWEAPVRRQSEHIAELCRRHSPAGSARLALSELREPRRNRPTRRRARGKSAVAARSRRRAALSRRCQESFCPRTGAPHGDGRALRPSPRHGKGDSARGLADLAGKRHRAGARDWRNHRRAAEPGAMSSSRARRCRRATICRSSSTTRCRASRMSCAGRICSGRRACIACCNRCSVFRCRTITTIV